MANDKEMIFAYFLQISNHMWCGPDFDYVPWVAADPWDENNNCDLKVFDEMIDFIAERRFNMLVLDVGDAIKLQSHPEIAAADAWSIDFLKQKLAYIRSKGIEVIPKLNFSAAHNVWQHEWRTKMVSPEYPEFCRDVIREVIDIFDHPRFFHLGMDEETYANQKRQGFAVIRNETTLWDFLDVIFGECLKNGARPWIFSDMYWTRPDEFVRHMPKEVVQGNWYYGMFDPRKDHKDYYPYIDTYYKFDELGYDQIATMSSWSHSQNCDRGFAYLKEHMNPEHLLGYITIPWFNTTADNKYDLMNDADRLYQARRDHYPETLK